jgi:hypothetical protein
MFGLSSARALPLTIEAQPVFHPDSYGYRPGRSALDAVETCRQRCWKRDWVIDLDVASFDSVGHELIVKAVKAHTDAPWVLLYVTRWLTAPLQQTTTGPCCTETKEPPRARRSRPYWPTCSCTTRLTTSNRCTTGELAGTGYGHAGTAASQAREPLLPVARVRVGALGSGLVGWGW